MIYLTPVNVSDDSPSSRGLSAHADDAKPDSTQQIKVLILVPSLAVGGAEMDLVRTLPQLDRARFKLVVCTFMERGTLGKQLLDAGIELVGPFSKPPRRLQRLRSLARHFLRSLAAGFEKLWPISAKQRLFRNWVYASKGWNGMLYVMNVLGNLAWAPFYLLHVLHRALPIARYIRSSEIDVVHTILPNAYLVGACANSLAGWRPLLMSRLSLNWYQKTDRFVGAIERYVLHRIVNCAIGNAKAILKELRAEGIRGSKLRLVYNGIDIASFTNELVDRKWAREQLGIPAGTLAFSMVANLFPYKGHRDLIDALSCFRKRPVSEWVCLLAGRDVDGNLTDLLSMSNELGLSENIRFLGPRDDIPLILSAVDIHLSTSHQEGFPNNIVEAMCASLPVVATAVGGVPELVLDGYTGLLVPAKEAEQMADALYALTKDPDRRKALGEAGRARVESNFTIERNVAAFESIYAELGA